MARTKGIITQFNGGELSPLLAGRVDTQKYPAGLELMQGFMPTTQGPALSIPGTRFVAEIKDSSSRAWLIRFEFNSEQSYVLEFGVGYIRFFTNRGQVLDSGSPYEIASPYTAGDITNPDGTFGIRAVQSGDIVYLLCATKPPQKLARLGATNWTISAAEFKEPPWGKTNSTSTTIYASAETGTGITLTASAAVFNAGMVGTFVRLDENNVRSTPMWEPGKSIAINAVRRSSGNYYKAVAAATTGGTRPVHFEGTAKDGDPGVEWEYVSSDNGYAKITAFTSATLVTADVVKRLPAGCVGSGNATPSWAFNLWGAGLGFPTCGTFFRERLVLAGQRHIAFSVAGDFEDFATKVEGSTEGDAGFVRELASDRVNDVRWLSPGSVLLVGTSGDELSIAENSSADAFGASNAQTKPQSTYGSGLVAPVRVGDVTVFVQKVGRKIRAMGFNFERDGYRSPDITEFADHLTESGVIDAAYQQEPWPIIWTLLKNGELRGCLYNADQGANAWFRHKIEGGVIESMESISSPAGDSDDLWMIVRLVVNGVTRRYVCHMENHARVSTPQADWFYVECGATYSGAAATTISGLGYLEGKEVDVLADGAAHPRRVVAGGQITLQAPASKVQVGLPATGTLKIMPLNFGQDEGTAQGKPTRVSSVVARLWNSWGGAWGGEEGDLKEMQFRSASTPMGKAQPAFTGDIESGAWPDPNERGQTIIIKRTRPGPLNIIALMPTVAARS